MTANFLEIPFDKDVIEILGRPNFLCSTLAEILRLDGQEIPRKAEREQAAVIHWLLNLYLRHGKDWRKAASDQVKNIQQKLEAGETDQ